MRDAALDRYSVDLQQSILLEADVEGSEQLRPEVFTRHLIEILQEAGEIEEGTPCHHRERGVEVHGYGIDDEDTLNLIGTIYTGSVPPDSVSRSDVAAVFRRMAGFWERCRRGPYHEDLEESSQAYDMALHIHRTAPQIRRLKMFVVTDGRTSVERLSRDSENGNETIRAVWDLERLHRLETSGQQREPIAINFVERFGEPLRCLPVGTGTEDYDAMLTVIPGSWLGQIYDDFGARLLELNVRSFLQASGKVNQGIRNTLRDEPGRFLAYNNGISATASEVALVPTSDGGVGIGSIRDLQIVNGGQTTASVHRALLAKADLSAVAVQAKVTVVAPERLGDIVPLISKYANSQNKVSEADLKANDPFHVEVEAQSRTVWTPATGDSMRQTRWFYERARGQYADAHAREGTPARQRAWKQTHPPNQKFTKTDLAKYENAWSQLPHEVSRGAQKNFIVFMTGLVQRPVKPDHSYFQRLVAKAILWKSCERIVTAQQFGGYRANLVAYSIAKLSHGTSQRIDLQRIWDLQTTPAPVDDALEQLAHMAWDVLVNQAPVGANITEWAKRPACWDTMRQQPWKVPDALTATLRALGPIRTAESPAPVLDDPSVARCAAVGSAGWFAIANWAKQTGNLEPWHRKLSFDLGTRISRGRPPSAKQAQHGARILDEVERLGFEPPPSTT